MFTIFVQSCIIILIRYFILDANCISNLVENTIFDEYNELRCLIFVVYSKTMFEIYNIYCINITTKINFKVILKSFFYLIEFTNKTISVLKLSWLYLPNHCFLINL